MSELDLSRELTVRTFGFNVPCRQFIVAAKVTRDRRMPIVDEFVLRCLKLCDLIAIGRLASFFGFTSTEAQVVVADLVARSLVLVEGDAVRLHPAANEMFRTSPDGVPRVMEVESWVEWLWFDLISGNMISREGLRRGKNLVELDPPSAAASVPVSFARQAFEENFREYVKNIRKINNPDAFSLYAVTDVRPGEYGYVPLAGQEYLVLHPEPKLRPSLLEVESDRPHRLMKLTEAMTERYRSLTSPEPSGTSRSEYCRLTHSRSLQDATSSEGLLDLKRWMDEERRAAESQVTTLVGSAYLERNRKVLRDALEEKFAALKASEGRPTPELVWIRPSGSSWGVSDDLRTTLAELRAVVRQTVDRHAMLQTSIVFPAAEKSHRPHRFNRIFDQGFIAPAGYLTPGIELVLVPGVAAIILVWVRLSESAAVWVGRATGRAADLKVIEERIQWSTLKDRASRIWSADTSPTP
jgi:hypothetical protein